MFQTTVRDKSPGPHYTQWQLYSGVIATMKLILSSQMRHTFSSCRPVFEEKMTVIKICHFSPSTGPQAGRQQFK